MLGSSPWSACKPGASRGEPGASRGEPEGSGGGPGPGAAVPAASVGGGGSVGAALAADGPSRDSSSESLTTSVGSEGRSGSLAVGPRRRVSSGPLVDSADWELGSRRLGPGGEAGVEQRENRK